MRKLFDLTFFPFLWKLHPTESKKTSVSEFNACAASTKPPVGSELSMCRGCPRALKLCQKPIKLVYISSVIVKWCTQPVAQLWVDGIDFFLYLCIHICRNWHYKMAGFLKLHNSWNRRFRELPIFWGVLRYMNFWFVNFFSSKTCLNFDTFFQEESDWANSKMRILTLNVLRWDKTFNG